MLYNREGKYAHTCVVALQNGALSSTGARQVSIVILVPVNSNKNIYFLMCCMFECWFIESYQVSCRRISVYTQRSKHNCVIISQIFGCFDLWQTRVMLTNASKVQFWKQRSFEYYNSRRKKFCRGQSPQ